MPPENRIATLDAFRGIAVIWVLIYHYCVFFTPAGVGANLAPYSDAAAFLPLAEVGYLGVILFFIISGYVISLTLTRTVGLQDFAVKRMARLWPALLFCGTLTFGVAHGFGVDQFKVGFAEYLISLAFLPPEHVGRVLGAGEWQWLDSAYWSLWVEVRFYAVIGVFFYVVRKHWFVAWALFELFGWGINAAALVSGSSTLSLLEGFVFSAYTPYFTIGIFAFNYKARATTPAAWGIAAMALAHMAFNVLTVAQRAPVWEIVLGYGVILGLFAGFLAAPGLLRRLEAPWLLKVGRSSYSLYLLHQVIGLSVMVAVARVVPAGFSILILPATIFAMVLLAYLVFMKVEQPANRWLIERYVRLRGAIAA